MSEEEKKAIEVLKEFKKTGFHTLGYKYNKDRRGTVKLIENTIETILNLIEKQQAKIEKKDKLIYTMGKAIYRLDAVSEYGFNTEDIIEYFTKLVEEKSK